MTQIPIEIDFLWNLTKCLLIMLVESLSEIDSNLYKQSEKNDRHYLSVN
jgi:hypothetical protein